MVIFLCVVLLVGSALALVPTIKKVYAPSPYVIAPFSLNDNDNYRLIRTSAPIYYGANNTYLNEYPSEFTTLDYEYSDYELATYTYSSLSTTLQSRYRIIVEPETYVDFSAPSQFYVESYESIIFSGGGTFYLNCDGACAYPDTVSVLINELPVDGSFAVDPETGVFLINDLEVLIGDEDIMEVGLRFTWISEDALSYVGSKSLTRTLNLHFVDDITITPSGSGSGSGGDGGDDSGDGSDLPYASFFNRVIAWEQSIYSAIVNGNNSSNASVSRIASVFAREDDVILRDNIDGTLQEVITQFYDQTSTSSSSMTVETVQNVKGISDGMDAMFSSGYSVSDAFTEIADNDDFMSWFTSECAASLDSTGQAATFGDDDPYNMHYYYEQVNAIAESRGG